MATVMPSMPDGGVFLTARDCIALTEAGVGVRRSTDAAMAALGAISQQARATARGSRPAPPEPAVEPSWLTVADVAGELMVTEQTVRRWCLDGRLNGKKVGRAWLIEPSSLANVR